MLYPAELWVPFVDANIEKLSLLHKKISPKFITKHTLDAQKVVFLIIGFSNSAVLQLYINVKKIIKILGLSKFSPFDDNKQQTTPLFYLHHKLFPITAS